MSSGMDVQMDPDSLGYVLQQFDPMVTFTPVPWRDLPTCVGCPTCDALDGCDSTSVLFYRRYLRWDAGRPVYSAWTSMPLGACCLSWELRQLLKKNDPTLELRVEVLREA